MRKITILVAGLMLLGALPGALANHLSVGYHDHVATRELETPQDKSVPDEAHQVGISEECYEAEGNLDTDEAQAAITADDFCGKLVYDPSPKDFKEVSTPDQHIPAEDIDKFDVQTVQVVFDSLGLCEPFCPNDPGGDLLFDTVHQVGSAAGLTHDPGTARDKAPEDRDQAYTLWAITAPEGQVQDATNAWEMNGWIMPSFQRSFIAFLQDDQGEPIGPDELRSIHDSADLPDDATPKICGVTPDADFISTGTQSNCEIDFDWVPGDGASTDADFKSPDYDEPCHSPTYVCGANGGSYWAASSLGLFAYGGQEQVDHFRWHWFVSPTLSDCGGLVEPRMTFDTDTSDPYLAHDLDVYEPATSLSFGPEVSPSDTEAYATAVQEENADPDPLVDEVTSQIPGAPEVPVDTSALSSVDKQDRQEPNNAVPLGPDGIDDNSQVHVTAERSLGGCEILQTSETTATLDPWVNIIDNGVTGNTLGFEAYGNTDESQDANNAPGPDLYSTSGMTGVFADKDDDGEYDPITNGGAENLFIFGGQQYQPDVIQEEGAYPMMWDLWIDEETGEIDPDSGCGFQSSTTPISEEIDKAGYGPNTGLVQAIYLQEPTVFVQGDGNDTVEYPGGNNIYLLGSQGAKTLYELGDDASHSNELATRTQELVDNLEEYAISEGANADTLNVEFPGDELGLDSDFASQCGEETGGFSLDLQFLHDCSLDCSGDTIATMYTFQVDRTSGQLGGGDSSIPPFEVGGDAHNFGQGIHTWYDVDPFDNNPDRNDDSTDRPPTGE